MDSFKINFKTSHTFKKIINGDTIEYYATEEDCSCAYLSVLELNLKKLDLQKLTVRDKFLELSTEKFQTYPIQYGKDSTYYDDKYGLRQGYQDFKPIKGLILRRHYLDDQLIRTEVLNLKRLVVFTTNDHFEAYEYINSKELKPN